MILSPHHYEPHSKSVFQKNCVVSFSVIYNINLTTNWNYNFFGKYISKTKLKKKHVFTKTKKNPLIALHVAVLPQN